MNAALAALVAASFGGCTPQDLRTVFLLGLPLSFGWKLFKMVKERRAPKYVFQLPDGESAMLTDERAKSRNRWRRWMRREGTWERRPAATAHEDAPRRRRR